MLSKANSISEPETAVALVSIIIRTKDRPEVLENSLKSVVLQSYSNIEIVVINDGTEDVEHIVKSLSGKIAYVYIHFEHSRGRAAAANAGLKAASGEYINFLDDDDVLYPDHVMALMSHLMATKSKLVYSDVLNVHYDAPPSLPYNRIKEECIFNCEFDAERLLVENYIPIMSVLFSKDILLDVHGFDEDLDLFEDWDFWIRVSRFFTFCHLNKTTAEYRFYEKDSMEQLHHQKYRYEEARAAVYDRLLPMLSGQRLVSIFNGFQKKLSELEMMLNDCECDRADRLKAMEQLNSQLLESEADRHNRLQVIHGLEKQLAISKKQRELKLYEIRHLENSAVQAENQISALQAEIANKQAMHESLDRKITNQEFNTADKDRFFNPFLKTEESKLSYLFRCFKYIFANLLK